MNDNELERWAEQQEAAREVRGGMVIAALVTVLAALMLLALLAWGMAAMLGGAL